jgi:amidase
MTLNKVTRRGFLQTTVGAAVTLPLAARLMAESVAPSRFDPSFGTATEALAALAAGAISSRELTEHVFARIRQHNGKVNAFVTLLEEPALANAREADERRARKQTRGVLDGLPVLVKDMYETAGVRTTAGLQRLRSYVPTTDATVVARLKQAGAIIVGKTNTPEEGDAQTYNDVAGTTNNPWDETRTPGGSTGGGAAALASGFGFLEIGSDIGGSIRVPSHFCGVYGHKSSLDIVPQDGHIPGGPREFAAPQLLGVGGPLARSAADLLLELNVVAGPTDEAALAYRWQLPPSRGNNLRQFRLGFVADDGYCPLDAEVAAVVADALDRIRAVGVSMKEGWPAGFVPSASYDNYSFLLGSIASRNVPDSVIEQMRRNVAHGDRVPYALGATATHREWDEQNRLRIRAQAVWREYFKNFDAFVSPVCFVAAFPHDHSPDRASRTIGTASGKRPYLDVVKWIAPATLLGCPATVIPIGRTSRGLPVGLQIMGPYMEDATPLTIAMCLEGLTGGFMPPPGLA